MRFQQEHSGSGATRLFLVRHASVQLNSPPRYLGRLDPRLSQEGTMEARALAAHFAHLDADQVACSPSQRARQTAEIALERPLQDSEILDDLRELDFGEWEGLTFEQAALANPEIAHRWAELDPTIAPPGGERLDRFLDRVEQSLRALLSGGAATILVISHGGVIRAAICRLLQMELRNFFSFDIAPASVTTLEAHAHGVVLRSIQPINAKRSN